jgi:hypothetical protein
VRERGFRFRQCDTLKSVEDVAIGGLDIPRDGLASIVRGRHNTTEAIVPFLPSYFATFVFVERILDCIKVDRGRETDLIEEILHLSLRNSTALVHIGIIEELIKRDPSLG